MENDDQNASGTGNGDSGTGTDDNHNNDGDGQSNGSGGGTAGKRGSDSQEKFLKDIQRFKSELKTLKEQNRKLSEDNLKTKQDWEALAKKYESERDEAFSERDRLKNSLFKTQKFSSIELEATKAGLRTEALDDLENLPDDVLDWFVDVETTSNGRFIIRGADKMVEHLKLSKPHWFNVKKAPVINSGGGNLPGKTGMGTHPDELRISYMQELQKKDPAEYKKLLPEFVKQAKARKALKTG